MDLDPTFLDTTMLGLGSGALVGAGGEVDMGMVNLPDLGNQPLEGGDDFSSLLSMLGSTDKPTEDPSSFFAGMGTAGGGTEGLGDLGGPGSTSMMDFSGMDFSQVGDVDLDELLKSLGGNS
jgi:hypothetical protein